MCRLLDLVLFTPVARLARVLTTAGLCVNHPWRAPGIVGGGPGHGVWRGRVRGVQVLIAAVVALIVAAGGCVTLSIV